MKLFGFGKRPEKGKKEKDLFLDLDLDLEDGFETSHSGRNSAPPPVSAEKHSDPPKEKQSEQPSRDVKYVEAWGAFAAMARFRGILLFCLAISQIILAAAFLFLLATQKLVVVGIDQDGRPSLLKRVSHATNVELFIRDFAANMFSYSPETIDENIKTIHRLSTENFREAFESKLGKRFANAVKKDGIVQVLSIRDIRIQSLENIDAGGFTAEVFATRYRSSNVSGETLTHNVRITIHVQRGAITQTNAWGYYVDSTDETVL
jgi:type IV secretory pathway component VirB8